VTAGAFGVALLVAIFFSFFFNRFVGLCSGDGEYASGITLLHGRLPYRDYFVTAPPLNILKSAVLLKMFGQALIVSRVAGVLERIFIGVLLFAWLAELFLPWQALVASVVTLVVSSGDHADPIASYNHDAILFAMLAGFSARIILRNKSERRLIVSAVASGAFAAASFLTKQTVGFGALLLIGALMLLLLAKTGRGQRALGLFGACYAMGALIPLAIVSAALGKLHLLTACLHMVFVTGPAAKASDAGQFLFRYLLIALRGPISVFCGLAGIALSHRAIRRGISGEQESSFDIRSIVWSCLAGLAIIAGAALLRIPVSGVREFSKGSVYFVFIGLTLWFLQGVLDLFRAPIETRTADCLLLAGVGWAVAVSLSLSWPVFEAMELPGLGLLAAAMLAGTRARIRWIPLLLMAVMVFIQVRVKLEFPFDFASQFEPPIYSATHKSSQPALRGMRMSEEEVRLLDDATAAIRAGSKSSDHVFTHTEMALVYALSDRYPPTRALSQNMDTLNDALAEDEARGLLKTPPGVIVYTRPRAEELKEQEVIWRYGRPSGERAIIAALDSLVAQYNLSGTYVLRPGDSPIYLYVRQAR
jgi:hypothetical protein